MPFELQTTAAEVELILAGRLGVQQARPLWDALQPALAAQQTIHLQAVGLDEIDTSIVQILVRLACRKDFFQLGATSDSFFSALQHRGLEKLFVQSSAGAETPTPVPPPSQLLAKSARQGRG